MIFEYFCSEHSERIYVKDKKMKQKYGIFDAYKNN